MESLSKALEKRKINVFSNSHGSDGTPLKIQSRLKSQKTYSIAKL
jgi:hypothetical protein